MAVPVMGGDPTIMQTLASLNDSWFYQIVKLELNESDGISGTEGTGTPTLTIGFDTDVTDPFLLSVPVVINASSNTVFLGSASQSQAIPSLPDTFLTVRLWFDDDDVDNNTTGHVSSSDVKDHLNDRTATYTFDRGDDDDDCGEAPSRYLYLQMTYETPEPATFGLMGSALIGLAILLRRRRRN